MTSDTLTGLLRQLLTFAGGILVARGYLSSDSMALLVTDFMTLVGAAMTFGSAAWVVYRTLRKTQIKTVAAMTDVKSVTMTTKAAADAIPVANVVAPSKS